MGFWLIFKTTPVRIICSLVKATGTFCVTKHSVNFSSCVSEVRMQRNALTNTSQGTRPCNLIISAGINSPMEPGRFTGVRHHKGLGYVEIVRGRAFNMFISSSRFRAPVPSPLVISLHDHVTGAPVFSCPRHSLDANGKTMALVGMDPNVCEVRHLNNKVYLSTDSPQPSIYLELVLNCCTEDNAHMAAPKPLWDLRVSDPDSIRILGQETLSCVPFFYP